jgi:hypothetical protein
VLTDEEFERAKAKVLGEGPRGLRDTQALLAEETGLSGFVCEGRQSP